jgi:hypothetical protein
VQRRLTVGNGGEPTWQKCAYWARLVSFFAVPLIMLVIHLVFWDDRKTLVGDGNRKS